MLPFTVKLNVLQNSNSISKKALTREEKVSDTFYAFLTFKQFYFIFLLLLIILTTRNLSLKSGM